MDNNNQIVVYQTADNQTHKLRFIWKMKQYG